MFSWLLNIRSAALHELYLHGKNVSNVIHDLSPSDLDSQDTERFQRVIVTEHRQAKKDLLQPGWWNLLSPRWTSYPTEKVMISGMTWVCQWRRCQTRISESSSFFLNTHEWLFFDASTLVNSILTQHASSTYYMLSLFYMSASVIVWHSDPGF